VVLVECGGKNGTYQLEGEATDILTGETLSGRIDLPPYGIRVLKR